MKIIVLGGGVIGVTTAYYLTEADHEVTLVERRQGLGLETSFANGGQISAGHAAPWASPQVPRNLLKWLGKRNAPLIFHFKADPYLWAWSLRFLRNCGPARFRVNTARNLRLALYSRDVLRQLRAETGLSYDERASGILHVFHAQRALDAAARFAETLTSLGARQEILDGADCARIEPTLRGSREEIAGGVYSPDDESGDAYKFTCRLAEKCRKRGVSFRFGVSVDSLIADGGEIDSVLAGDLRIEADAYVVALGSYSPKLIRGLGLRLPVYPVKGYSVTLPTTGYGGAPTVSITDEENRVVISRLGERLRAAGTAEIAGYDLRLNEARCRAILHVLLGLFPEGGDASRAEFWTGLRPMTPDGAPVLGPTPFRNLYLNTGHGSLGWTMACGAARVVSDLVSGREPDIDVAGLTLSRFGHA